MLPFQGRTGWVASVPRALPRLLSGALSGHVPPGDNVTTRDPYPGPVGAQGIVPLQNSKYYEQTRHLIENTRPQFSYPIK